MGLIYLCCVREKPKKRRRICKTIARTGKVWRTAAKAERKKTKELPLGSNITALGKSATSTGPQGIQTLHLEDSGQNKCVQMRGKEVLCRQSYRIRRCIFFQPSTSNRNKTSPGLIHRLSKHTSYKRKKKLS